MKKATSSLEEIIGSLESGKFFLLRVEAVDGSEKHFIMGYPEDLLLEIRNHEIEKRSVNYLGRI